MTVSPYALDDSAVVWSHPPAQREGRPLVILMHGRGSHERDLTSLIPMLPGGAVFASLRAPLPFESGDGWEWFASTTPGAPALDEANAVTDALIEWCDRFVSSSAPALVGFSQGGAMATHAMRRAPERFSRYVSLAGFVVPGRLDTDAALQQLKPPVFWGRDEADPVIPTEAVERTAEWLPVHSSLVERTYPGIGHSISREEMADVAEFLAPVLD